MNFARHVRKLLPLLKLGTELVEKIPTPADTWPQRIAKVLAILDATNKVYGGGRSKMREFTERYSLVERESETFVRLFFATTLRDLFTLRRQTLDEREELIEAVGADGERMFFRETHYGNARIESDFRRWPSFDKVARLAAHSSEKRTNGPPARCRIAHP